MELDTNLPADRIVTVLLEALHEASVTRDQLLSLLDDVINDVGMNTDNPIENSLGRRPAYVDVITNLTKQNDKQRKWLEEKNAEIHSLNLKLADRRQEVSNYYERTHAVLKVNKATHQLVHDAIQGLKNNPQDMNARLLRLELDLARYIPAENKE